MTIRLIIPVPPSANRLWRYGARGRCYRSAAYSAWLQLAGLLVRQQIAGLKMPEPPVEVRIVIHGGKGWRKGRDADNAIKPLVDLCCHAGVLPGDDSEVVRRVICEFIPGNGNASCIVEVKSIEDT